MVPSATTRGKAIPARETAFSLRYTKFPSLIADVFAELTSALIGAV